MRTNRLIALGATLLVVLGACSSGGASTAPSSAPATAAPSTAPSAAASAPASAAAKADIRIGSDDFYESKLMAELYAQALEHAGYKVTRNLGLGARPDRVPAFEGGQVDLVPEYVGSGLGFYDKTKVTGDGEANGAALQAVLDRKGNSPCWRSRPARTPTRPSSARTRPLAQADEDERPGRGPGPAQVGPAARLRQEPVVQGRARVLWHHLPAEAAPGARRV